MARNNYKNVINLHDKKVSTVLKSILIGVGVGATGSLYRIALTELEHASATCYAFVKTHPLLLPVAAAVLLLIVLFQHFLITRNPTIGGSGIPQVKAIVTGNIEHHWFKAFLAKFFGGALAIFAGLSLGREGPSIQMGALVAEGIGSKIGGSRLEKKILIASGSSAGLAVAFNAPLAGVVFVLEEIFKYFSPLIFLSATASAVVSDFICNIVFGIKPTFDFKFLQAIPLRSYWILILLGIVLGIAGAFYNRVLLGTIAAFKKLKKRNAKLPLYVAFGLALALGLTFPAAMWGGSDALQYLKLSTGIGFLLVLLAVKFCFSMISFGSGVPGGIFFPMLIIGSVLGAIFFKVVVLLFGVDAALFNNFILIAMAGFFTAVVRAPLTGIVLIIELSDSFSSLLPLTVVVIIAYIVADLVKSAPIYESLYERLLAEKSNLEVDEEKENKKITIETLVHHGSAIENKLVKHIGLPEQCLLIAVRRESREFIPKGNTQILAGDYLYCITNVSHEPSIRAKLDELTNAE